MHLSYTFLFSLAIEALLEEQNNSVFFLSPLAYFGRVMDYIEFAKWCDVDLCCVGVTRSSS